MIPVQWQKEKEIFGDAIKFAPDELEAWLKQTVLPRKAPWIGAAEGEVTPRVLGRA